MIRLLAFFLVLTSAISGARAENLTISSPDLQEARRLVPLVKEMYARAGHAASVEYYPTKRSLIQANAGITDAELARVPNIEGKYTNLIAMAEPIYAIRVVAIAPSDSATKVLTWETIKPHRIAYMLGVKYIERYALQMQALPVSNTDSIARMVANKRVAFGVMLLSEAEQALTRVKGFKILDPPLGVVTLYHYLHIKHRRKLPALEKALIELNDSGEAQRLLQND